MLQANPALFAARFVTLLPVGALAALALFAGLGNHAPARESDASDLAGLGKQLFFDTELSFNRTQSCATCHDPDHAFADPREGAAGRAVSQGDDGKSYTDRNAPTLTYAALTPAFHVDSKGRYKGGLFWDGRANDLVDLMAQPILNPAEMAMPDRETVIERLRSNPGYVRQFTELFGEGALDDVDRGFHNMSRALAAYLETPEFMPFDSKYDRWKRGEEKLTPQEEFGYVVFITWNCHLCHMVRKQGVTERETFTSYEYHNIGIPLNPAARAASGKGEGYVDVGLAARPGVNDPKQAGKFRVPTLRNVAVTGPYMHNGIFEDLRTAVLFYNVYTSRLPQSRINPETGEEWGNPEVPVNLSLAELRQGLMLNDERVDALVAFMETLTDRRYEPLLERQKRERKARAL